MSKVVYRVGFAKFGYSHLRRFVNVAALCRFVQKRSHYPDEYFVLFVTHDARILREDCLKACEFVPENVEVQPDSGERAPVETSAKLLLHPVEHAKASDHQSSIEDFIKDGEAGI